MPCLVGLAHSFPQSCHLFGRYHAIFFSENIRWVSQNLKIVEKEILIIKKYQICQYFRLRNMQVDNTAFHSSPSNNLFQHFSPPLLLKKILLPTSLETSRAEVLKRAIKGNKGERERAEIPVDFIVV